MKIKFTALVLCILFLMAMLSSCANMSQNNKKEASTMSGINDQSTKMSSNSGFSSSNNPTAIQEPMSSDLSEEQLRFDNNINSFRSYIITIVEFIFYSSVRVFKRINTMVKYFYRNSYLI